MSKDTDWCRRTRTKSNDKDKVEGKGLSLRTWNGDEGQTLSRGTWTGVDGQELRRRTRTKSKYMD